jgi:hypothetical protein
MSSRCACIFARLRVERAERLVHQQDARAVRERARDRDALLHPARQLVRIHVGEAREPDQIEPLQRLALGLAAAAAVHPQAEHHVLLHGEPRKQRVALKHHPAIGARPLHRLAVEQHLTARLRVEPGQDADQRRLAAARRADHADELAPVRAEADVVERDALALRRRETLADVPHVEDHVAP